MAGARKLFCRSMYACQRIKNFLNLLVNFAAADSCLIYMIDLNHMPILAHSITSIVHTFIVTIIYINPRKNRINLQQFASKHFHRHLQQQECLRMRSRSKECCINEIFPHKCIMLATWWFD